jgi:hypothetical protein
MTSPATELTPHPAAEIFPLMSGAEFSLLVDSIKANGLNSPIVLHEGQILDGRNRYNACKLAGVEPRYEQADLGGQSPAIFVIAANVHRRQMTQSQRAAVAVGYIELFKPAAKAAQEAASIHGNEGGRGHKKPLAQLRAKGFPRAGKACKSAAAMLQCGHSTVEAAYWVYLADRQLFERLKRGEISANAAYAQIRAARPRPEIKAVTPRAKRIATEAAAEEWRLNLCKELRARREAVEGRGKTRRWTPENICKLDLVNLLNWIESELNKFPGDSANRRDDTVMSQPIEIGA